jgi:hypothetical protein
MSRQVQESIHLHDGDSLRASCDFRDLVARTNFSFLYHTKVKSWSVMRYEQGRHSRVVHADADTVARHPRLADFKHCIANAISITDADLVVGEPLDGKVFPKLAEAEVVATKKAFPIAIRVRLVNKYGALLAAVSGEIGLSIAVNIELAHHASPGNRKFPDCRSDNLAVPRHFAWKANIH